jgi:glycosyltransferase involved in cell wall biosynthesis
MRIGILLPGFSSHPDDWAIPVQQNLARELAASDDLRIIALRYPHRRDRYVVEGATVYSLGVGQVRAAKRIKLWWDALRLIESLHHEHPFDILHTMWADETGLIAAWAGRRLGVPVVVSILGGELVGFDEIGYGLQRSAFSRWIVRQALKNADRVIIPSSYVQRLAVNHGVPEAKIVSLTLGVDASRFTPPAVSPDPYRLVHVASLVPIKDQVTLLRAFALLDSRATLDILGEGSEHTKLEALARDLGISDRVHLLGAIAHPDLPTHYQQAAINLLSSRHETIAMTTLEAAACGVPTVSTNVGIVPDYPALGLSVPVGDAAALAQAIQSLQDSPERQRTLSRSARETVERKLSIRATADQLRGLYRELTGKT